MNFSDSNGQKSELRSSKEVLTIIQSLNHATSYLWLQGWTHTHMYIHTHTHILCHVKVISRNQAYAACGWHVPGFKIF